MMARTRTPACLIVALAFACQAAGVALRPHAALGRQAPALRSRVRASPLAASMSTKSGKSKAEAAPPPPPEVTFFEGPPSWTEIVVPAVSIITVLGIVPFAAALSRQAWTRYKITNRRLSIQSGWGGNDLVEIVYRDIVKVTFIFRFAGLAGDMVMQLSDGAKLEIRSMPDFDKNYDYIMSQVSQACRDESDFKPLTKQAELSAPADTPAE